MSQQTTLTTEHAKYIAANPDCSFASDLITLVAYIGPGSRPAPQAACLYPMQPGDVRIETTVKIREYCKYKAKAMMWRERGDINEALNDERLCELIYNQLPPWAKW